MAKARKPLLSGIFRSASTDELSKKMLQEVAASRDGPIPREIPQYALNSLHKMNIQSFFFF